MSLTSDITRMSAEFEAAQAIRMSAIATIRSAVKRDLERGRAVRLRVMAAYRKGTKSGLKEIFGGAAFLRGTAADLVDGFTRNREKQTDTLQHHLRSAADEVHEAVEAQLETLNDARHSQARREGMARRAYVKALRRRVETVLVSADRFIKGLHKDRISAERVWEQHGHAEQRQRKAAMRAESVTVKRANKKRKAH